MQTRKAFLLVPIELVSGEIHRERYRGRDLLTSTPCHYLLCLPGGCILRNYSLSETVEHKRRIKRRVPT